MWPPALMRAKLDLLSTCSRVRGAGDNCNKIYKLPCNSKFNETSIKKYLLKNKTSGLDIPKHLKFIQLLICV